MNLRANALVRGANGCKIGRGCCGGLFRLCGCHAQNYGTSAARTQSCVERLGVG